MERAALQLHDVLRAGTLEEVRAQRAYIVIGSLLLPPTIDIDKQPELFLHFLQSHYQRATSETLELPKAESEGWPALFAKAALSFRIKGSPKYWEPNDEELVTAILDHDPRVEFNP